MNSTSYKIVAVSSMEQLIGGALATAIGIMLPMLLMVHHPELPSFLQGLIGAMGLIGIGIGSMIIGDLSDKYGYLAYFRLCPVIIMAGSLICFFFPNIPCLIAGLLIIGIGVGGGYSLDSAYISELLPPRWSGFMVGVAKATSSIGFVGAAVVCIWILRADPNAHHWNHIILVIGALGLTTLLMRLRWWESPKWLLSKGRKAEAQKAAEDFLGKDASIALLQSSNDDAASQPFSIGKNISKIIYSGIPWACEGLAVYGFSVFLPVLIMALGLDRTAEMGISKIISTVEVTAVVNFFMLPGFVLGLIFLHKVKHSRMMSTGFILSAAGLLLLWAAYMLKWHMAWMIIGFAIFELSLNAGPHLLTFIIPSQIYPVNQRAEGSGIAALMGKVGAISGVILMPMLLHWGGVTLVLVTSAAVMLLGAVITIIYSKIIKPVNS